MRRGDLTPSALTRTYLYLMLPLFIDPLLSLGTLLVVFDFADNGLNLDLGQRARESVVEREMVVRPDVAAFGMFR